MCFTCFTLKLKQSKSEVMNRADVLNALNIRCPTPSCGQLLDPTPDACCAMQCLCCGKHFCFVCMKRCRTSKEAHAHALSTHTSIWPTADIVERGHMCVRATAIKQLMDSDTAEVQAVLDSCSAELMDVGLPIVAAELISLAEDNKCEAGAKRGSDDSKRVKRVKRVKRASDDSKRGAPMHAVSLVLAAKQDAWDAVIQSLSSYTSLNTVSSEQLMDEIDGWTVLDIASMKQNEKVVRLLLVQAKARGCLYELLEHKVGDLDCTPLVLSVESGNLAIVNMLLHAGADCSGRDMLLAALDNDEICARLINHALDLGIVEKLVTRKALRTASFMGNTNMVLHMVEALGSTESMESIMSGALHVAAEGGNPDTISVLLEHGADTLSVDDEGQSPLMIAAQCGNNDAVWELTFGVGLLRTTPNSIWNALHIAAKHNKFRVVQTLIDFMDSVGVSESINIRLLGQTPLMTAAAEGNAKTIDIFLAHEKTDFSLRDCKGKRAIDLAVCLAYDVQDLGGGRFALS